MTESRWIRRGILAAALLAAVYWTRTVWIGAFSALAGALVLCVLLSPLCAYLERRGLTGGMAAGVSLLALLLAVGMLFGLLLPVVLRQSGEAAQRVLQASSWIAQRTREDTRLAGLAVRAEEQMTALAARLAAGAAAGGLHMGRAAADFFFSVVLALYLLADRRRIGCHVLLLLPVDRRQLALRMVREGGHALMAYGSGQMKSCGFVAAATGVGLLAVGVPDALLLSLLMGVLEMIPYIGPALGCVPILLSAVPLGLTRVLWALFVVLTVQQLEGSFVSPYFMASATQIPPIAALLCAYVGGSLFGLAGVALAMPVLVAAKGAAGAFFHTPSMDSRNNGVESF